MNPTYHFAWIVVFTMLPLFMTAACGDDGSSFGEPDGDADTDTDADADADTDADSDPTGSGGCGNAPIHDAGGVQVTIDAGGAGDGMRGFYLSLPETYDPDVPHRLILGYPGTSWVGEQIQPYLGLESSDVSPSDDEIFVYPDPLWRDFDGWGNLGGWLLGPNAYPADGNQDLVFTEAIIDYMAEKYCIDTDRVFATGHSWGGDMAMVVACFLGDRFRAAVPVAANRPYWFDEGGGWTECVGETAMWHMFGYADDHFPSQDYAGQFGDECRDFWLQAHDCTGAGAYTDLGLGPDDECVEFDGCAVNTRYCLYDAVWGHQIPADYYAVETMGYFRSF